MTTHHCSNSRENEDNKSVFSCQTALYAGTKPPHCVEELINSLAFIHTTLSDKLITKSIEKQRATEYMMKDKAEMRNQKEVGTINWVREKEEEDTESFI